MSCDGCEDAGLTPPTIVVGGTNPKPLPTVPQTHAKPLQPQRVAKVGPDGSSELNTDLFPPGTPPALLEVLNQLRSLRIEMAAAMTVLERRGLVTALELQEARVAVNQAVQQAFEAQQAQLGRAFMQQPTHYPPRPPADPRRPQ